MEFVGVDFWNYTFYELNHLIRGEVDKRESRLKQSWTQNRWLAFMILQPHLKKGINKPKDLCVFDWERKKLSKEQIKELSKKLDSYELRTDKS